ncbi:Vacuolar protein sorting-associated protein 41, partial [Tulasnella sp. 427]
MATAAAVESTAPPVSNGIPNSPERNAATITQPTDTHTNGTSGINVDDPSSRLTDSPVQESSVLANGHPPELHPAPESAAGDDESEDDEDDDEEEEPVLKYEKMGGIVNEILEKDTASAIAVSSKLVAIGTHNGVAHIMDFAGNRVKSYRSHRASINDIRIDSTSEFVATASMDGQAAIVSISGTENYGFDLKRPLRAIALDPHFAKRGTRAFVCGGMAGTLVMHEKGWLGHKETTIHSNEGPIWAIQWQGHLIAWANDNGVKIYDTQSQERLMSIARPANSPRADLFKCTLRWTDDTSLIIAWADHIMLARIRTRGNGAMSVEVTAHFQVDCMLSGIAPHPDPIGSFLTLDYVPPDTFDNEATANPEDQRRKAANRPELRIISSAGEELSSDALTLKGFHMYGCNDYLLEIVRGSGGEPDYFIVVSPKDIIIVKLRDAVDHINWLVEQELYEEALEEVEKLGPGKGAEVSEIGRKYIEYLIEEGEFEKAAKLTPRVFGQNAKDWENSVFYFAKKKQLQGIIPFVPTKEPRLSRLVYDMIIVHFLEHDQQALLTTIKEWPSDIYDLSAAIVAVKAKLDRSPGVPILMECLAELYMLNRQPGKALEYYLRLRKPHVFDLIREHNLFTVVRDQVLLLMEFDQELERRKKREDGGQVQDLATPISPTATVDKGKGKEKGRSKAVALLVDHTYAIPTARVVQQLQPQSYYLYLYLDALFDKDPYLAADFSDEQVQLYADFEPSRLIDFLRASNYYSLAKAYDICEKKDLVPEMVFLLGRMGNNKKALNLIIEKLGDVNRAIDFAKEQNDDDLWEDLLKYSETRPLFIRGLLEN